MADAAVEILVELLPESDWIRAVVILSVVVIVSITGSKGIQYSYRWWLCRKREIHSWENQGERSETIDPCGGGRVAVQPIQCRIWHVMSEQRDGLPRIW